MKALISTSISDKRYVLAWLLLVALPGLAWYLVTTGPVGAIAFRLVVPESVYLANLRSSQISCESLSLRRPQIVTIGDSHSYADWDFPELQRRSGMRAGSCALGGLYLESVPMLLDYVASASPDARVVVLGLSPRMFWESPSRVEQVESHRKLIPSMKPNATPYLKRVLVREALPYDYEPAAIARHAPRIEALDERAIREHLAASWASVRTLKLWRERLQGDARRVRDAAPAAREICERVHQHRLRLWVLHMPESPFLEENYSDNIWRAYALAVDALRPCAEKIFLERAVSYGLGNRHYVNRELRDDHDYGMWSRPGAIKDDSAFDADHLNPVGARRFTRAILEKLLKP